MKKCKILMVTALVYSLTSAVVVSAMPVKNWCMPKGAIQMEKNAALQPSRVKGYKAEQQKNSTYRRLLEKICKGRGK